MYIYGNMCVLIGEWRERHCNVLRAITKIFWKIQESGKENHSVDLKD